MNTTLISLVAILHGCRTNYNTTHYNTTQLTAEERGTVKNTIERAELYDSFVQDFAYAADPETVFGIDDGPDGFIDTYYSSLNKVKDFYENKKIVSYNQEEYPEKGVCFYYHNHSPEEEYIACDNDLLNTYFPTDGLIHEGAHAFLDSQGDNNAHSEELEAQIDSETTYTTYYTAETAKIIIADKDIPYDLSFVLFAADFTDDAYSLQYQLPLSIATYTNMVEEGTATLDYACHILYEAYVDYSCEEHSVEKTSYLYSLYDYFPVFGITQDELQTIAQQSGICEANQMYAEQIIQENLDCR